MFFHLTLPPRNSWPLRLAIAAGSMAWALALTHAFWQILQHTPFLLGFGAAILSSRVGGRQAGFLAVIIGVLGYAWFPPPLAEAGLGRLLFGFVVISGAFSWLVARRYEIEAALSSSEARLREAQGIARLGHWQWDVARDKLSWSDVLYQIFGVDQASFRLDYASFLQLVHPEDRSIIDRAVRGAVQDRLPYEVEYRIIRPDGDVRVIHGHGRVVLDHLGRVIRLVGTAQDITERKAAEEIVSRSERRLKTVIDAEPACVKLVSPEGMLLHMNRAGLEMVGAENLEQIIGRPVIGLVHPDDRSRYLEMHRAAISGAPGKLEFRIAGLDRKERWVESHVVPFDTSTDRSEPQLAVLSVTSDVTERKHLEDQLRQSQKMEAIGLLAGGIAHDFNNLLTAIGGYTEMTLKTLDEGDVRREDLQEAAKAAQRAAALTRQLLAVSRQQILQPTVLDLNEMVGEVQKLLRRTIPEHISLQLELSSLDPVRADRGQLEQVVLNLAINAGDAMPQGGELRLATETVDIDEAWALRHPPMPAGRYVRLTVSDTGSGMRPETQARIFEPFFTTKERGKGTGLGLATVYGIVKQSDGFIWVDSQVERGTTFAVYLPVVHEPVEPTIHVAPAVDIGGGSQTILLAEDDGAVRRLARDILAKQGYTVLDARDGDEALASARQYPGAIHLLITDVVMPGLSGRDLAVRLTEERPNIRVLYTSGYTENVMIRAGFNNGLTLLAKPFLPGDLLRKVKETLATTDE
jgi:two-component system, cell cycle sensor histidine kinase and response regulator CckA